MAGINWLVSMLRRSVGGGGNLDERMTADRALSYAPVWYAVNKIAGHVAYLPLNLHKEEGDSNTRPKRHLGYRVMRLRANTYQTPYVFKRQMMSHALLWGNGRAYIHRRGLRTELVPLMPDRCATMLVEGEKVHFYKVDRDERLTLWDDIKRAIELAKRTGTQPDVIQLDDADVLHIHGLGFDGVEGKSLINLASQSWGLGLGAESQERTKQKKGYAGGLMLQAPEGVFRKQDDAKEFLNWFRSEHANEDNAGKIGLLREGITANVMAMSNTDAQFIEQRKFQRQEAALWFLLEQILGDDSSVSYNSLEQKNLAYLQNCLAPWLTIWEEESEAKLLTPNEIDAGHYFKFNDGALLRTDKQTTATIASTLISARVINPNEAREMFDMNPYEGGDVFENPAVSSGQPGSSEETDEVEPQASAVIDSKLARIEHLMDVEAKQMQQACKAKNFVDKVDRLCEKWQKTWAKDIGEDLAAAHCEETKRLMFDCANSATDQEQLTNLVTECTAAWQERVDTLMDDLELLTC